MYVHVCVCVCVRACVCAVCIITCLSVCVCMWVQECDKKEADCELSANTSRERYQAKCREMGIKVGSILYLYVYVYRFVICLYLYIIWYAFIHYWLSVYTASFVSLAALFTVCAYVLYVCIRTCSGVNTNTVGPTDSGHIVNLSWNVFVGKHARRTHSRYAPLDGNVNWNLLASNYSFKLQSSSKVTRIVFVVAL